MQTFTAVRIHLCVIIKDAPLTAGCSEFILPGSHGVIFPWTPPPFGIPSSIWRKLREELIQKVVDWAIAQVDHLNTSRQSSPYSEASESEYPPPALPQGIWLATRDDIAESESESE